MEPENKKIYVTQPFMPPLDEFVEYLKKIWDSKWLTNNGQFHQELEKALCEYLGVKYISLFNNGTLALITALQALRIGGEVITTPYSFVATTHALHWNGIKPVFVDIDPADFNLDPEKIEAAITPKTTAILPVHVYGNPCKVEKIKQIADTYGLKVIYDACHAFGVRKNNESILNFGDLSVLSFHATKVFNTFEGGAIVCHDEQMKKRIDFLKNFGFADEVTVVAPGINAKMNEVQAAFGLFQLKYVTTSIDRRREIANAYRLGLIGVSGVQVALHDHVDINRPYPYFPILINEAEYGLSRNRVYEKFRERNVYARRYFYPIISEFSTYRGLESSLRHNLPRAIDVSSRVLCLPIFPDLQPESQSMIIELLRNKFQ